MQIRGGYIYLRYLTSMMGIKNPVRVLKHNYVSEISICDKMAPSEFVQSLLERNNEYAKTYTQMPAVADLKAMGPLPPGACISMKSKRPSSTFTLQITI